MREGRHGNGDHRGPHERPHGGQHGGHHSGHRESMGGPEHERGGRGGRGGRGDFGEHRSPSAQTFRRGRAVAFLDRLMVNRSTLLTQLNQPEYEAIKTVISGELKAVDSIIQEFIHAFELHEVYASFNNNNNKSEGEDNSNGDNGELETTQND